ncbi:MAG: hypothetical protein JXA90_01630 [Planctomycetes bacterium]|nr:hypothetical protein [Planctomycetota bacterium]
MARKIDRRNFMKRSLVLSTGAALAASFEEEALLARPAGEASPSPPAKEAGKGLPVGRIGSLKVSRLFCGGNLIGGWAHSRDLVYVSELVKAYHTDEKVFETLELAERSGINAVLTNPRSDAVINRYWKERGGKIQWISDCAWGPDIQTGIQRSIDSGAHAVYVQGGIADAAVRQGKVGLIGEALEFIRKQKVTGGIGAHCLETVQACVDAGLDPDFWVKTLHTDKYWSATPEADRPAGDLPPHDNMWCTQPETTIEYMKSIRKPWIAFKVLAAGAIHPRDGFRFAFESGADFVCAGMFDFQLVEDAVIARRILGEPDLDRKRPRPWTA